MSRVTSGVELPVQVTDADDVVLISNGGTLVRIAAAEISTMSRNTQGVTLVRLREGEALVGVARIAAETGDEASTD